MSAVQCHEFDIPATFLLVSIAAPALVRFKGEMFAFTFALNSTDPDIHVCNSNTNEGQCALYLLGWSLSDGSLAFPPVHITDETGVLITSNVISSMADGEVAHVLYEL